MVVPTSSVQEHMTDPQNRGVMRDPTATGQADIAGRPPTATMYLQIVEGLVTRAMFEAQGCGYTIACCSVLTTLTVGQAPRDCLQITAPQLAAALGGLPDHRQFCAALAVEALHRAAINFLSSPGRTA